jgi:hypothetical protein
MKTSVIIKILAELREIYMNSKIKDIKKIYLGRFFEHAGRRFSLIK